VHDRRVENPRGSIKASPPKASFRHIAIRSLSGREVAKP
jgi:hypothetical protein